MYIYYKINQENIYNILSSLIIDVSDGIVYEFEPDIKEKEIIAKIKIKDNDRFNIINVDNKTGLMNNIFNMENIIVKFFFYSNEEMNEVKKLASFMKEIKLTTEDLEKYFYVYYNKNSKKAEYNYKRVNVISNENQKLFRKLNLLKGVIYGALEDKNMVNKHILQEYAVFYNEYKILEKMIIELKDEKKKNFNILKSLYKSKKVFQEEIEKNLSSSNYENMIIQNIDKRQICFNNGFLDLINNDNDLFNKIMSLLINNLFYIDDNKIKITKLVKLIKNLSHEYRIESDYELLYKRVIEEDFTISIDKIKNIVIKNLFVACIKYDNNREFISFLIDRSIEKKYLANMFLGGIIGFMYLSTADKLSENNIIIKHNLRKIENKIIRIDNQRYLNRLKIHYYLDKLYESLSALENDYEDFEVKIDSANENVKISLKNINLTMVVYYHERNKNLANAIKYYDNRVKSLQNINKNYVANNIYFNYNFVLNNKMKTLDYRYEYIYSTILEYIYMNVRKSKYE